MEEKDRDPVALHVIVVGFHHKKGMQVKSIYVHEREVYGEDCLLMPTVSQALVSVKCFEVKYIRVFVRA